MASSAGLSTLRTLMDGMDGTNAWALLSHGKIRRIRSLPAEKGLVMLAGRYVHLYLNAANNE